MSCSSGGARLKLMTLLILENSDQILMHIVVKAAQHECHSQWAAYACIFSRAPGCCIFKCSSPNEHWVFSYCLIASSLDAPLQTIVLITINLGFLQ